MSFYLQPLEKQKYLPVLLIAQTRKKKPPFVLEKTVIITRLSFFYYSLSVNVFIYSRDDKNTRRKDDSCFGRRARKINTIHILREGILIVFCQKTLVLFCSKKLTQIITLAIQRVQYGTVQLLQYKVRQNVVSQLLEVKLYVIVKGVSISNEVSTISLLVVVVLTNRNSTFNA